MSKKRVFLLVIVFSFITSFVYAQFTEGGVFLPGVYDGSAVWGDYDNDGDLDFVLTGYTGSIRVSRVYRHDTDQYHHDFIDINAGIPGVYNSSVAWGDYDNDGDLDLLLAGFNGNNYILKIYRYDGNDVFTEIPAGLQITGKSTITWVDYDNDGDLDISIWGDISKIYSNDGSNVFTEQYCAFPTVNDCSVVWGDYDNDGDLDVVLTGNTGSTGISRIYRNNGNNAFTYILGLETVTDGTVTWGDFNSDGYLDIFLTGYTGTQRISRFYANLGNGSFSTFYPGIWGVTYGAVACGDYDNDGDPDILLTGLSNGGRISKVYRNDDNFNFTDLSAGLTGISDGSAAWGDYDNDGKLDIIMTGTSGSIGVAKIYHNEYSYPSNTPPTAPTNLQFTISGEYTILSWDAASDDHTPTYGLSYVLRIGTSPGGSQIATAMSSATGLRQIAQLGYANGYCSWKIKTASLERAGRYYWSVQAIDGAFAGSAFATETYNGGFMEINSNLAIVYNSSVAWGDYDNDGDLDILLTGQGTGDVRISKIYRNDGGSAFTDIGAGLMGVINGSVAWGDYDNDGDLDILLTGLSSSGRITKIYRNDGSDIFTDINAGLPGVYNSSVTWGDYDNDGDLDILLTGNSTGNVNLSKIYRNDGSGVLTDINAGLTGVTMGSVTWCDYDNDGDLDILLTGYTGSDRISRIYRNDSNGVFTDLNAGLPGVSYSSVAWGDYDFDGDLDILLAGDTGSSIISKIYRNNGNSTFTDINAGLPGVYYCSVAWGDYDNDGDLDILLTGGTQSGYLSSIYRNNSLGSFTDINSGLPGVWGSSTAWGDYDNDGNLDILLTGHLGSTWISNIYRNNYNHPNTPPATPTNLQTTRTSEYTVFSWNAPSDDHTHAYGLNYVLRIGTTPGGNEISASMSSQTGYRKIAQKGYANRNCSWKIKNSTLASVGRYYWSVQAVDGAFLGSAFSAEASGGGFSDITAGLPGVSSSSVSWGDYDNDGDLDILLTGSPTTMPITKIYRNNGNNTFTDIAAGLPGVDYSSVAWGDYDNDGDLDVLLSGNYITRVYSNDNGVFTNINAVFAGLAMGSVAWGDYDNDGDLDILLTGSNYDGDAFSIIYRNNGNNTFTDIAAGLPGVKLSSVAWGDYDNDGDLDILLTGSNISRIYRNNSNNTFTYITAGLPGVNYSSAAWGDFDNDGDLDILLTGYTGSSRISRIYRNNGNNSFTDIAAGLTGVEKSSAVWGDYDNDGYLDVYITGYTGSTMFSGIYHNNGNDSFTNINAGLPGLGYGSSAWGDYDNDGDLDILVTGHDGSTRFSRIYRNDYNFLNLPPSAPTNLQTDLVGDYFTFSWDSSTDGQTPAAGLNYVLRIGTTSGGGQITAPMSASNGYRKIAQRGYANGTCEWKIKASVLTESHYYWSVQAIDGAFTGSTFAAEQLVRKGLIELATASPVNYGGIYLGSHSEQSIWLRNTGTLALSIESVQLIDNSVFECVGITLPLVIAVRDSVAIPIKFTPRSTGLVTESISINNNSINNPQITLNLTGTGVAAAPKAPDNVSIIFDGYDALISWDAVTETIYNTPIVPDYYIVFYNGSDNPNGQYYYLGRSFSTSIVHDGVAIHAVYMFYHVLAYKNYSSRIDDSVFLNLTRDMTEEEVMLILNRN